MLICVAALRRRESRGGHFRSDFSQTDPTAAVRRELTRETTLGAAREVACRSALVLTQ